MATTCTVFGVTKVIIIYFKVIQKIDPSANIFRKFLLFTQYITFCFKILCSSSQIDKSAKVDSRNYKRTREKKDN